MRAPISVVVELVEGCTRGCAQCGLQAIREPDHGGYQYMTRDTLWRVCQQVMSFRTTTGLNISGHGEPTMHPEWERMVMWLGSTLRRVRWRRFVRPPITLTTSGQGLLSGEYPEKRVVELLTHAVDTIVVGVYQTNTHELSRLTDMIPHLRATVPELQVGSYPGDGSMDPLAYMKPARPRLIVVGPRGRIDSRSRWSLDNQGGVLPDRPSPSLMRQPCHLPFTEMHVRWDGGVALCTNDWLGEHRIGSVHEETIAELWDSPRMRAARSALWHRGRAGLRPCERCTRSFGVGRRFLEEPRPPSDTSDAVLAEAQSQPPMTRPVIRV